MNGSVSQSVRVSAALLSLISLRDFLSCISNCSVSLELFCRISEAIEKLRGFSVVDCERERTKLSLLLFEATSSLLSFGRRSLMLKLFWLLFLSSHDLITPFRHKFLSIFK
ncbi:hypothetical protein BpHYR1_042025 [Brachionus plicatilis]|uniref:Uncharacterized protein n=1 Tax=Brachionus plicatilis TaxID=10195 RepID=A0A3M7PTH2_BRAPC|nr:hypothetical protein BpHYR1_042025 [Brachionus plicatilis]